MMLQEPLKPGTASEAPMYESMYFLKDHTFSALNDKRCRVNAINLKNEATVTPELQNRGNLQD
jgi:hypothetical protein